MRDKKEYENKNSCESFQKASLKKKFQVEIVLLRVRTFGFHQNESSYQAK